MGLIVIDNNLIDLSMVTNARFDIYTDRRNVQNRAIISIWTVNHQKPIVIESNHYHAPYLSEYRPEYYKKCQASIESLQNAYNEFQRYWEMGNLRYPEIKIDRSDSEPHDDYEEEDDY